MFFTIRENRIFVKYERVFNLVLCIILSILMSIIIANRSDTFKERNDTAVYKEHYQCLVDGDVGCKDLVGGIDYVYYPLADIIEFISFGDFFIYKYFLAFLICLPIILFVVLNSPSPLISLAFLLADYRFYEYSGNVLRHGLALSVFCLICVIFNKRDWKYNCASLLPALTHLSAFVLVLVPRNRLSRIKLFLLFAMTIAFLALSSIIISINIDILPSKLVYYIKNMESQGLNVPLHYLLIFIATISLYTKIDNSKIFTANIVIILFLSALVMNTIGMGYRYISFLLPFSATLLPHLYILVCKRLKGVREFSLSVAHYIVIAFCILLFSKYYNFILIHLS